jgi:hypothetical protein
MVLEVREKLSYDVQHFLFPGSPKRKETPLRPALRNISKNLAANIRIRRSRGDVYEPNSINHFGLYSFTMAKKALAKDQIVKLIVGAGQASPSPPVGPALGSKGVKSMDFCKVWTPNGPRWCRVIDILIHPGIQC